MDTEEKKEHIEIYEWIVKNINQSDSPFKLDGCLALVNLFRHKKFKKHTPSKEEIETLAKTMEDSIFIKRETVHKRNHRDKKNNH